MINIEIKNNGWRVFKLFLIAIVFFTFAILMIEHVISHYNDVGYQSTKLLRYKNFTIFISVVCILFCGGGLVIMVYRLLKNKLCYFLRTDINGIEISSFSNTYIVKWSEVKRILKCNVGQQLGIAIDVFNRNEFIKRESFIIRKIMKGNVFFGYPPIVISVGSIKINIDEVISELNKYLEEWKVNNQTR